MTVRIQGISHFTQAVFANFTPDKSNSSLPSDSFPRPLPSCYGPFVCLQTAPPGLCSALGFPVLQQPDPGCSAVPERVQAL